MGKMEDWNKQAPGFGLLAECGDFVVVEKPPGVLIHPTRPGGPRTLWHELREWLCYELAVGGALSILTRLDRETSGLVLVATRRSAARRLGKAMMRREIGKEYLAIVRGHPADDAGWVDAPLLRAGEVEPSAVYVRQKVDGNGRPSRTGYTVIERGWHPVCGPVSLVRLEPRTGRMHQLRVHMAWMGHPLVGDKIYTSDDGGEYLEFIQTGWTDGLAERLGHWRQALHASALIVEGRRFDSVLPEDLAAWWEGVRSGSVGSG